MQLSRFLCILSIPCAVLAASPFASAAEPGWGFGVTLTSDYVFRGISQTDNNPAAQGEATWRHQGGFYAGGFVTTQDIPNTDSHFRADGFAGVAGADEGGVRFDVGAHLYSNAFVFPGQSRDFFWEIFGTIGYAFADFTLAHDFDNKDSYARLAFDWDVGSGVRVDAHAGRYFVKGEARLGDDYNDFGIGAGKTFGSLDARIAVTYSDQDPGNDLNDAIFVLAGTYRF
jgi:uncharacterized protein (TIGR02001 family)